MAMKNYLIGLFLFLGTTISLAQENCANAIDDDSDGLIDMNDPNCICTGLGGGTVIVTSLIPNPSFENFTCCPSSVSQLNCSVGWIQASVATSDYFNLCGYQSIFAPPQQPLPGGGAGYVGFYSFPGWEENVGSCLISPMLAGQSYTLSVNIAWSAGSSVFDLSLYGTSNCADLPWPTSDCALGNGAWQLLGTDNMTLTTDGAWQVATITFTPGVNINAVSIGGPCGGQTTGYNYYFADELTLALTSSFNPGSITESGGWCSNDLALTATTDTSGGIWQWYQAGIALVGETSAILNIMPYGVDDYTAVYTVGTNCESSDYTVTIPDAPFADFSSTSACLGTTFNFTDNSTITTGTITNWDWDFGDGNTSTNQNPSNTFTTAGTYNVELTVTSNSGCTNTFNQNVIVYPDPVSDFEFVINGVSSSTGLTGGCLNDIVVMDNNATVIAPDNITINSWDFGDGSISLLANPSYQYAASGNYTIQLAVQSNNGCQDTLTMPITIFPSPVADFTVPNVCAYDISVFTDASTIGVGTITNWEWDFGDAATSILQNPTHQYASNGNYNVELVVTSNVGCTDTIVISTTVYEVPVANYSAPSVCENDPATFTDISTLSAGTLAWTWDFDDATTSAAQHPNHAFSPSGTYQVELLVASNNGCLDSITIPFSIFGTPTADFTFVDDCFYNSALFTDISSVTSGTITQWQWNFGDAGTSAIQNPTHTYNSAGSYVVELIVTSGSNCKDTLTQTVVRYEKPLASFNVANECIYDAATVNELSTVVAPEVVNQWNWNFGDGATSTAQSGSHQYAAAGNYTISLTSTTNNGCVDDTIITVTIYPQPNVNFSSNSVCENTPPTTFTNITTIANGTISTWAWTFGDASTSPLQQPNHTYASAGNYSAQLIATSNFGCQDTLQQNVIVHEKPTANFTSAITTACNPACIDFTDLSSSATATIIAWYWNFDNGQILMSQNPTPCYTNSTDENAYYDVSLIATNSLGCKDTIAVSNYIEIIPMPIASFVYLPQTPDIWDTEINFNNTSVLADAYKWNFGDSNDSTFVTHPIHIYDDVAAHYLVTLIASSNGGLCVDTAKQIITIQDVILFYVPNIFTPDGDEYNEYFQPVFYSGFDPFDFHLVILNRWGEVIFESYDASKGWSGTYGDQGLVEDGIYIWSIEFKETMSDKRHKHNGHVTVLK